jgi:dipeptidyl aminopeptidase/acylaminoacyl peptidase
MVFEQCQVFLRLEAHLLNSTAEQELRSKGPNAGSMSAAETVQWLEALTRVPFFGIVGATPDTLIGVSNETGITRLLALETKNLNRTALNSEVEGNVSRPSPISNQITITRDTTKGKELHQVYLVDTRAGTEALLDGIPPMRITTLEFDGVTTAFVGASEDELSLYTYQRGALEKRARFEGLATVTHITDRYVLGDGHFRGSMRSRELFFFDRATSEMRVFSPKEGSSNAMPRLKGSLVLFRSDCTGRDRLHVHDIEGGKTREATFSFPDQERFSPAEFALFDWTPEGAIAAIGKKNGEARLFLDGKEIPTLPGYVDGLGFGRGKAYFSYESATHPSELMEWDPVAAKLRTVVPNPLPEMLKGRLGVARMVHYRSFDGRDVSALVIDKGDGQARRTVTYIHGGPWDECRNVWDPHLLSLSLAGYHVVAPNYRGSTGYGAEFAKLIIGDPGGADFRDMVESAHWARENGVATELAIAGYSYGGFATLLALGREPELWTCGVAGAPVPDWKEMCDLSDGRKFVDGLFDHRPDLFGERSPLTYVKNVRQPLCLISSQNDSRTPMKPVLRYAMALLEQGSRFELHAIPDMGHALWTMESMMNVTYPMITFLVRDFPPDHS